MRKREKSFEERIEEYRRIHKRRKIKYLVFWGVVFAGIILQKNEETLMLVVLWLATCEIER